MGLAGLGFGVVWGRLGQLLGATWPAALENPPIEQGRMVQRVCPKLVLAMLRVWYCMFLCVLLCFCEGFVCFYVFSHAFARFCAFSRVFARFCVLGANFGAPGAVLGVLGALLAALGALLECQHLF